MLLADLTEKEGEYLNLLHCMYELGHFYVPCRKLMQDLGIDYAECTAIGEKMRALHVADWKISLKRATPGYGGLFIMSKVRYVWHDFCEQKKERVGDLMEWEREWLG